MSVRLKLRFVTNGIGWPRVFSIATGEYLCLACQARQSGYRVDDLAWRMGISTSLLRHEFRKVFGISLKGWLSQVRAVELRKRIAGDETFGEIAAAVGFSHAKELSREFRRVYGVTPTVYRARCRK